MIVLLCLTAGMASAQNANPEPTPETVFLEPLYPSPVEEGMAPIDDVQLYYATYGDPNNEPLLLLHGGLGSANEFIHQIPAFADHYYVVVSDERGRGRSTASQKPLSYELMAADTLALMDYLRIDSANLVGWSDGGIIGLEIPIHHPQRLHRLVAFGAQYSPDGFTGGRPTTQCAEYLGILSNTYAQLSLTRRASMPL